jgi:GIY-YIG catalytic domain
VVLGLIDILKLAGFEALPTKLVRHQDRKYPWEELLRQNWLELYQQFQSKPRFDGANQIVSFCGLSGNRARFYGVYKVLGHTPAIAQLSRLPEGNWPLEWCTSSQFFYNLARDPKFDDLRDRVIIDWGPAALAWVQKLDNKPVLEILPPGRKLVPFDDYLEFSLTFAELKDLFGNEIAHRDWQSSLSAVGGVYLILDQKSGHLYVGSACGAEGIWGRWRNYVKSGHGGNVQLQKLVEDDPASYPERFRFSVLQILPKTMTRDEVVQRETRYKHKLGTRATGLNSN